MALPVHELHTLRLLEGGRAARQAADEAHIELVAHFDEAIAGADAIHALVAGLAHDYQDSTQPTDLRWHEALRVIGRLGSRAAVARDEYLSLTAPTDPRGAA